MESQIIANRVTEKPWQRDLCQFFTRAGVARYCLGQLAFPGNILSARFLEPAAGHGAFMLPLIPKLVNACRTQGRPFTVLRKMLRAFEIDSAVADSLRHMCAEILETNGVSEAMAKSLTQYWIRNEDFIDARIRTRFTHIVSNPPYIRWESIPADLRASYIERFYTFKHRADLYVAFIERSLALLEPRGQLGFLCPGTWTRNVYGGSVRELLTSRGHLKKIIDFSKVNSFERAADAHPCFFVFENGSKGYTQIFSMVSGNKLSRAGNLVRRRFDSSSGPLLLSLNRDIENVVERARVKYPLLENAGCKIRVGSATGCNRVFLGHARDLPVEGERLLPFVNAQSIHDGAVNWTGTSIVNVFDEEGALVKLSHFPRLRAYLRKHKDILQARAKAEKSRFWWRSIDVLHPEWHRSPKLLIVDISAKPVIGLDTTGYCAGSGVYQLKTNTWPIDDLFVLLSAGVLGLFVSGLSAGIGKGFHRFQKRQIAGIPLPCWQELDESWRDGFRAVRAKGDLCGILEAVAELYECRPKLLSDYVVRDWHAFGKRHAA